MFFVFARVALCVTYSGEFRAHLSLESGAYTVSNSLFLCTNGAISTQESDLTITSSVFLQTFGIPALSLRGGSLRATSVCFTKCQADVIRSQETNALSFEMTSFVQSSRNTVTDVSLEASVSPVSWSGLNYTGCSGPVSSFDRAQQVDLHETIVSRCTGSSGIYIRSAWAVYLVRGLFIDGQLTNVLELGGCVAEVREVIFRMSGDVAVKTESGSGVAFFNCWTMSTFAAGIATYDCVIGSTTTYPEAGNLAPQCAHPQEQTCPTNPAWVDEFRKGPSKSGLVIGGLAVGAALLVVVAVVVFLIVKRCCVTSQMKAFDKEDNETSRWVSLCQWAATPMYAPRKECPDAELEDVERETAARRMRSRGQRLMDRDMKRQEGNDEWATLFEKPNGADTPPEINNKKSEDDSGLSSEFSFESDASKKKPKKRVAHGEPPPSIIVPLDDGIQDLRLTRKGKERPAPVTFGSDSDSWSDGSNKPQRFTARINTNLLRDIEPLPSKTEKKKDSDDSWSDVSVTSGSDWSTDASGGPVDDSSF